MTQVSRALVEPSRFNEIRAYIQTMLVYVTEVVERAAVPELCGGVVQAHGVVDVAGGAVAGLEQAREVVLRVAVALRCGEFVKMNRFVVVARHALCMMVPAVQGERVSPLCCTTQRRRAEAAHMKPALFWAAARPAAAARS